MAQKSFDTLKAPMPKHYFNTTILLDGYRKPTQMLDTGNNAIARKLKTYGIRQGVLAFQVPLMTKDIKGIGKDSNVIANTHLLFTGYFMNLRPVFEGIPQHSLRKSGIGLRYIYNTGKKVVWFFDASPFVTRDVTYPSKPFFRLASTIVLSYNFNPKFNVRIGATKSFLWGNRLYLPFIGFRVGRLDKVNLSVQFPRNASINLPVNRKMTVSIYTRPQGGVFNFSNRDTLYFRKGVNTFHLARYEVNTGIRMDVRTGKKFNFYLASGFSTANNLVFYSDFANSSKSQGTYNRFFFRQKTASTSFFNLGFVLLLGKTHSYYNNQNIYDAIDLNNTIGLDKGNGQIPVKNDKPVKDVNLDGIMDLIDYNDF